MPYEPPMKRNPRELTVDQHFHTAHAISKFYDHDGKVEVRMVRTGEVVRRHKRAKVFCTKRTWDQRAETGYMLAIETAFHDEIDNLKGFSDRNHDALSRYHLLWRLRHHFHQSDCQDLVLKGITGSGLTRVQEEIVESKGGAFFRDEGVVASRLASGLEIQIYLDRYWHNYEGIKWGLIQAEEGEFVVADAYHQLPFIPVSPNTAFLAGAEDNTVSEETVCHMNGKSIAASHEYYFAKELAACPVA